MDLLELSAIPPIYQEEKYKGVRIAAPSEASREEEIKVVPIPRPITPTTINLYGLDGSPRVYHTASQYFNKDSTKKGDILMNDLVACSLENSLLNSWEVPDEYLGAPADFGYSQTAASTNAMGVRIINPPRKTGSYSFSYPAVHNAKAKYSQSVKINVFNPASGARLEKNVYDLIADNTSPLADSFSFPYVIGADIRPDGCPIFSWQYNDGGTSQLGQMTEYIKGGCWRKTTITGQGVSGSYFDKLGLNQAREELNTRTMLGAIGSAASIGLGIASMASGPGAWMLTQGNGVGLQNIMSGATQNPGIIGGIAGLAGTVGSYIMASERQIHQQEMLNARGLTASVPIKVGNSDYARDAGANHFYFCTTRYDDEDMIDYDIFLQMFGYNVGNTHIGTQHFWCRKKFVYIRVNDITISSPHVGQEMLDKVFEQLKAGVRIWRCKPNIDDMYDTSHNREIVDPEDPDPII